MLNNKHLKPAFKDLIIFLSAHQPTTTLFHKTRLRFYYKTLTEFQGKRLTEGKIISYDLWSVNSARWKETRITEPETEEGRGREREVKTKNTR